MPESFARILLQNRVIIKPGLETSDPVSAVERYKTWLEDNSISLSGKHVLVFGYGGRLAVAVELLRSGCSHVTVCDLFPHIDEHINDPLLEQYPEYLESRNGVVNQKSELISAYHGDIRSIPDSVRMGPFDLVISSSVYEHLDDVDGITAALSRLMKPSGFFLAFVDLRDHYFKYPFEMLCYKTSTWKKWLNPTSNLNRYRVWDYRNVFDKYFQTNQITVLERDTENYLKQKHRIIREFKSGDDSQDAVTKIAVLSSQPIHRDE